VTRIRTRATIDSQGRITVEASAPPEVPPGEHEITVIIEEQPPVRKTPPEFPVDDVGPWPEGPSLRREDLYDDDGR
jgi:hypothetical protein